MWRQVKKIIQRHERFLLTTHMNPDGDGVGAASALTELLLQQNKKVRFVTGMNIPHKLRFLNFRNNHEVYRSDDDYSDVEVVIILDAHSKERIGPVAAVVDRPGVITICIDHHQCQGEEVFTPFTVIDLHACSVGAMVYTLFKECGVDLSLWAATGIYTSVTCDTGRFSYSSTDRKAHKIADECIKVGVDPDEMHRCLFQHLSLGHIKMFAQALNSMETYLGNKVVVQQISHEDFQRLGADAEKADIEYIHEFNKHMRDVECVVLLLEIAPGEIRVSLRSLKTLDVGALVRSLGGGGHTRAAGAICHGSLPEVKAKVLALVEKGLNPH